MVKTGKHMLKNILHISDSRHDTKMRGEFFIILFFYLLSVQREELWRFRFADEDVGTLHGSWSCGGTMVSYKYIFGR